MAWIIVVTFFIAFILFLLAANFITPEKKLERKIEHRYSIADPQFQREMSVLLGPSITQGNQVTAYQNGVEIFPAMLDAIQSAQTSITFETYIYRSGRIGEQFAESLSERARAGVAVNVIIDWVGSIKMEQALLDQMESAGVQLHRYRPLHWYNIQRLNNRTHRKLLVVDGKTGFTGGVGIADIWQGEASDPDHWRDSHFRIDGLAVAHLQAAFNDNWMKITGQVLNGPLYFPPLQTVGEMKAHMFIASPAGGSESMHLMYLMAIAAAEQSIDLAASYFIPDELIIKALQAARERGVRIRILVPGQHFDSEAVRLRSKADWSPLLEAGVEIYEYQPTMLHTKLLVIDNEFVSVGSTNFDIRSFRLNDEASLNIYNTDFARQMTAVYEQDLKQSLPYTLDMWKHRPWSEKLAEKILWPIKSQL